MMQPMVHHPASSRLRAAHIAYGLVSFALLFGLLSAAGVLAVAAEIPRYRAIERSTLARALVQVATDVAGEDPGIAPRPVNGAAPICPGVKPPSIKPFELAFGLMRGTEEGLRLYQVLIDSGVCVAIDDLSYAVAYAQTRWTPFGGWSDSRIVVDRALVRSGGADLLAAVLVHEATHIDRAISGRSCYRVDDCELLPNGVAIEEEIAAHAAEAEWWIEAYGSDGKSRAFGGLDHGENHVTRAYLGGDEAFRAFVTAARSHPREGEDFSTMSP